MKAPSFRNLSLETADTPTISTQDWLEKNPEALAAVEKGLQQSALGQTHYRGSFAKYADLDIEDEEE